MPSQLLTLKKPILSRQDNSQTHVIEQMFRIFLGHGDKLAAIPPLLEFIGHTFGSDRIYIFRKTMGRPYTSICVWNSAAAQPMAESLDELESLDWDISSDFPAAAFPDTSLIPEPSIRRWFEGRGAKAAFLFWLGDREELLHLIGMEDCHQVRKKDEDSRYSLYLISEILNLFLANEYYMSAVSSFRASDKLQ